MINHKFLPTQPGCYIYKDKQDNIIYVGKAKNLKKRVSSYFTKNHPDEKTNSLVKDITNMDYFVTTNEVEALILENNLIKQHKPKYNINLKESMRYAYISITKEKFPRLTVARDKKQDATYYGPFVNAEHRDAIVKLLRAKFQIRTCNKLPKKECLRYHLELCSAPCINKITESHYNDSIISIDSFLKGKTKQLNITLKRKMKDYSSKQKFEQAKIVRDQLKAIEFLSERQKVDLDKSYDEDIINYIVEKQTVYLIIFNSIKGILTSKHEFTFPYQEDFLDDFIPQFYVENKVPKEIMIPQLLNDTSIQKYLEKLRGSKVKLHEPRIGPKKELLDLVKKNVELSFMRENLQLEDLQKNLQLNGPPSVIECFDIAHISGTNIVGSMVQFRQAKPDKSNYRRFKVSSVSDNDDFASIAEVVRRRYARLKSENEQMPELIVIDGGKGQLSAALNELKTLELKIPIIGLAKKNEEIYVPGLSHPLPISKNSKGLLLLRSIRDEAHRFAQKYHKLLRSKQMKN